MKLKLFALALLALFVYSCNSTSFDDSSLEESFKSSKNKSANNSYLVISNSNKLPKNLDKSIRSANGSMNKTLDKIGVAVVTSDDPDFVGNASKIKGIQSVVPNISAQWVDPDIMKVSSEVDYANPPNSGDDDFFFDLQWGHAAIDAPAAWNAGQKGEGVVVAVLDTGFDLGHPDLVPNIDLALSDDMTGEGLQYTLPDPFSHGTHTAGTIGAADNAFGTIGVAPGVKLVLIKVLYDHGAGNTADILNGILYAASLGVDVINMSIGATFNKSGGSFFDDEGNEIFYSASDAAAFKNIYSRAITIAYQGGTTVITSAGNEATDYDHNADLMHLPSGAAHAISISATTSINWAGDPNADLDVPASYTNFGQSAIDFAAPGGSVDYPGNELCSVAGLLRPCWVFDLVFSTGNGGWFWSAGTSMAAPHAAGVAALIIGRNGGSMKPAQVEAALRRSSDDIGKPGNDDYYGAGRVNALNAVTQ